LEAVTPQLCGIFPTRFYNIRVPTATHAVSFAQVSVFGEALSSAG
jgi:hypothetical protein